MRIIRNIKFLHELRVLGRSRAGYETAIYLPQLGVCFDMGFVSEENMKSSVVCISHGHADHIGSLHLHAFNRRMRMPHAEPPVYIMPDHCVKHFHKAHDAYKCLNRHAYDESAAAQLTRQYKCIPVAQGFAFDLKKEYTIRAYEMIHTVPSHGFCIFRRKKKLLEKYRSLEKTEIRRLAKEGVAISENILEPFLAYSGDTTIDGILQHPDMLHAHILFVECTYIRSDNQANDTPEEAIRRGHIHEDHIDTLLKSASVDHLVIFHLSCRYNQSQVVAFQKRLQENYKNVNIQVLF